MAKKDKKEAVNANNLRSAGFAEFEANHTFTKESKLADFTRAAIQAGLTNNEIVEKVRAKVNEYYEGLDEAGKAEFVNKMIETVTIAGLIDVIKTDVLKSIVPAEVFPVKVKAEKRELTAAEKLMKKQEAAEKRAAKLKAELEALTAQEEAV